MLSTLYFRARSLMVFPLFITFIIRQANAQSCLTNLGTGSSKATVWLKPENVVQSSGAVTSWTNAGYASALSSFVTTGTGSAITYQAAGLNFNPTVQCNAGQYMRVANVARSTFMPDNTAFTSISVHYSASGIMFGHQTGSNTNKITHELGGGFVGSSPAWFTFPATGAASLTTILVNSGTVFPYGDGRVGTTISNSPVADASADLVVGAFRAGEYRMNGNIGEILMYNFALSAAQRNQAESYLAAKYGITLDQTSAQNYTASDGTVFWNAASNGTRRARITVIGRDDCMNLNQKQSISSETGAMVTIGNGTSFAITNALNSNTFSADKEFLSFGDDNGSITSWSSTGAPTGRLLLARKWQVDETNTVDSVRIRVPDDGSTAAFKLPAENSRVLLMVDADGDFSSGAVEKPMTLNGTNWETNYNFTDGQYFTFATLAPGYTLPVQFSTFKALPQSNNNVLLSWNVDLEQNTRGYQIEKSLDGVRFSSIGFVSASGLKSYSYMDVTPTITVAFYRIRSIDQDNAYRLTTTVRIEGRKTTVLVKAFFSDPQTITIQHEAAVQGSKITVSAMDGRRIASVIPQAGSQYTFIMLKAEDARVYIVQYQDAHGEIKTIKLNR